MTQTPDLTSWAQQTDNLVETPWAQQTEFNKNITSSTNIIKAKIWQSPKTYPLEVADSCIHFLQKLLLSKRTEQQVRVNSIRRAKLILFYTLRVSDQREFKTVISLDPLEHYLGNTDGASNFSIFDNPIRLPKMYANIAFNVSKSMSEKL